MPRTRRILAAALAGAALVVTACGDGEEDTGRDDSVVETQTPAQPEDAPAAPGSDTDTVPRTTRTDTETTE